MSNRISLDYEKRVVIETLLKRNVSISEIANEIGCSKSTVYREIKIVEESTDEGDRNCKPLKKEYSAKYAEKVHKERLSKRGAKLKIGNDIRLSDFIEKKIKEDKYSPLATLMYIQEHKNELNFNVTILSVTTLYKYIHQGIFRHIGIAELPTRERKKKKTKRYVSTREPVEGHSIEDRDRSEYAEEIKLRNVIGHWEADTVCSGRGDKAAIFVLTDRATRLHLMFPLKSKNSHEVVKVFNRLERKLGADFYEIFKTITFDNGSEFSDWKNIEKAKRRKGVRFKMYYAHPHNPQERGSNENNNKLIRRWIPKGTKLGKLKSYFIRQVQDFISTYPRELFNGKSSKDMFLKLAKKQNLSIERLAI